MRSLYFDDARDSALRENLDRVGSRQKFRLRLYNSDPSLIKLEKKIKRNGLCSKLTEPMEAAAVSALLSGASWEPSGPLAEELHARMSAGLRPRTLAGLHPRGLHLPCRERTRHARLRHPHRPRLHRHAGYRLCDSACPG